MKYKIKITETLQRTVEVEADSLTGAIAAAGEAYEDEIIILDWKDLLSVNFEEDKEEEKEDDHDESKKIL